MIGIGFSTAEHSLRHWKIYMCDFHIGIWAWKESVQLTKIKCYAVDCFGTYFTHVPKLWCNSCSKCYGMVCFSTYFTHVQSCDVTRVQSATEWTASVHTHACPKLWCNSCSKCCAVEHPLRTCPNLWCNPCSKCYGMDCFGTYLTHVQSCAVTRVQSATEWTASVHISHTTQGTAWYRLHTCPKLWCNPCSTCYGMGCLAAYFTHVQSCDVTRVQSATQWTASVHTSYQDVMQYRGRLFTGRHVMSGRHMQAPQ